MKVRKCELLNHHSNYNGQAYLQVDDDEKKLNISTKNRIR
jgi:hypothetical protein